MKVIKRLLIILLIISMMFLLTACGKEETKDDDDTMSYLETRKTNSSKTDGSEDSEKNNEEVEKFMKDIKNISSEEAIEKAKKQMEEPNEGDQIAIFHIKDYGDITVKFFEDVAPKAVENFVTHAKEGYYNGVIFHRVIEEFMIQGGDPLGTGYGGESIWGEGFEEELSVDCLPYRGALCMASSGTGTKSLGSQFYIVQANYRSGMENYFSNYGLENYVEAYKQFGGDLADLVGYGQYTTFGQVISGMDVVDKIAKVETNPSNDKPLEDVVIESIEITTYSK